MHQPTDSQMYDPLIKRARALPEDIPPSRDLWPGIKQQIKTSRQTRWTKARVAAAAVILVGLSSAFTLWLTQVNNTVVKTQIVVVPSVEDFGPWFASDSIVVQARAATLQKMQSELAELSPATWKILANNLHNIELARQEISTALNNDPDSELLQSLLLSTYTNELTLLTQFGGMTRSAQQRTSL